MFEDGVDPANLKENKEDTCPPVKKKKKKKKTAGAGIKTTLKRMIDDGLIKTSGTLFVAAGKMLFYGKLNKDGEIYNCKRDDNGKYIKKYVKDPTDKFLSPSAWVVCIKTQHRDSKHPYNLQKDDGTPEKGPQTASGWGDIWYADNDEFYDAVRLEDIRGNAYILT